MVLEVGPGLGVLTRELARQSGWVAAIELDSQLASILGETLAPFPNVTIVNGDVLQVDPARLLAELSPKLPPGIDPLQYKVVANLPYYITSLVIRHFLEASLKPQAMLLMVQKEVAKAIVAAPGEMSILAVSVQFYGKPEIVRYVPAHCFYPTPKVDSAILKISLYPRPILPVADAASFFELVRAGFTAPRKQIINSLAQGLKWIKEEVSVLLERANISPQRRSETLALEEWATLWQAFIEVKTNARS